MAPRPNNATTFLAWAWFPTALIALLLLAIPGVVLFALNLLGYEGDINKWLQDNYSLTYHPQIPVWGVLILLLIPFAILLLYFLKLKRKPLSVPSTFLWRKSIEDLHVNSLIQWLRHNVLLLLQLLAVLSILYALMALRFHGRGSEGKHYILMIDNSASMAATDVDPNRLEWAKQEAIKEIDAASDNDFGMVIAFNSSAQIIQSYTSNRGSLRNAVESIKPTQRPTRIEEALSLADSLANPSRSTEDIAVRPTDVDPGKQRTYAPAEGMPTEVHLYSDGRFADVENFALGNLDLRYHAAGKLGPEFVDNVALVSCDARRDEDDASKMQVFIRVLNYRNKAVQTRLQLEVFVDGELKSIPEKPLSLPAREIKEEKESEKDTPLIRDVPGEAAVTFDLKDLDDRSIVVLHAKLVKLRDQFPLDDEAWLVVGVVRKARVLLVGNPNQFLDDFFNQEAITEVAKIDRLTPDQLGKDAYLKPASNGVYDLVIFDRCGPDKEEDMPRSNTYFIGYPPPPWQPKPTEEVKEPAKGIEKLKNPHIKGWMNKDPVLQYLTGLQEVLIDEAFKMKDLPPRTPRLIETDRDTAILLKLNRESFTDLVQTFPIMTNTGECNTNWPLQPRFPLFLRNVLYSLGNISDAAAEETVQPGQVKTLRPDAEVRQIKVKTPAGAEHVLERGSRADFAFGATDQVGVYQVSWGDNVQRSFAVNLLDAEESHLEPRTLLKIGEENIAVGENRGQPRELWKWILLAAILFLVAEWYIYNRRVYI